MSIMKDFNYPDCWNDDVRMDVLFSPFRLKSVNVESYMSKLNFWREMILRYCIHKGSADFNLTELRQSFNRKNKSPFCLQIVIDEMLQNKEIRLKAQFMNDPFDGWSSWAIQSFIKKPFEWAVHKIVYTANTNSEIEPNYMHIEVVKRQSNEVFQALAPYTGKVVSLEGVSKELDALKLNEGGLTTALHYLHRSKKLYVEYEVLENGNKVTLIKIPGDNTVPVSGLTNIEKSIFKLEATEQSLLNQMNEIETEIKQTDAQVRQYIREGKKLMAKNCLKKRHSLDKKFEKRAAALENIQTLIESVKDSEHTKPILEAYQLGSKTLKTALAGSDVNLEKVDEIMLDIKEVLETNDELLQSIQNIPSGNITEDMELEEELEELLAADSKDNDHKNKVEPSEPAKKEVDAGLLKKLENLTVLATSLPASYDDKDINAS